MTVEQDVQRAGLRALMANPKHGLPDYEADPNTVGRVGKAIGETAGEEERHIRASDSRGRFTVQDKAPKRSAPNIWLWSVSVCTSICTLVLLGVLVYWH